ncbi:DUF3565 domain-containing protein [Marinobacter daepoensis]|uniref:DUF3565 domain-containing protein n=1 Tax=Marinobacter daepoensis TaxID=262077 RepID=A0ABS3BAR3_9GAMM|nr:DUF3565 domain-containing protein [Marinobacter daepoensis]MBN7768704.1 DUF3565 domain-containing protein [Marinobacter daepoensis]MBY6079441.1 DUF3565 domain-containing protein [Marinobacter daepoensis]
MKRCIESYHKDTDNHWVARLACGHHQHVRHDPPWINRPWVISESGRQAMLGFELDCKKCDEGAPVDEEPAHHQARESR